MATQQKNKLLQTNHQQPWYLKNMGLIIAPLSSVFLRIVNHFFTIPTIYIQIADISVVVLFFIVVLAFFNGVIEKNKHYIYFIYLIAITIYVWYDFNQSDFEIIDLLSFLILFLICNTFFQRYKFYVIYAVIVLTLLGFSFIYRPAYQEYLIYITLGVFHCSIGVIIMLYFRSKTIDYHENYSNYLRKIINHPGIGYVLFTFEENQIIIQDNNANIYQLLGIENNENKLKEIIIQGIDNRKINLLKQGEELVYTVENNLRLFEIHIDDIAIKKMEENFLVRIYDVTEERKNEKLANQKEKKYRNLLEKNVSGVFTLNKNGNLIEINNSLSSILIAGGLESNEINFFFKYTQYSWEEIKSKISLFGNTSSFKLIFTLPKHTIFLSMKLYFDNETDLYEGTAIDVTAIEVANQKTKENEHQYLQLFQESNDAIFISTKGKIINVNNSAKELFDNIKLVGENLWDFVYSTEDKIRLKKEFNVKHNHPKKIFFECNLIGNNFTQAELSISIFFKNHQMVEQTIIRDISERKNYEKNITNSQQILLNTLENIPESIIVFNKEKIIFANSKVYQLLQIKEKKISNIQLNKIFKGPNQKIFQNVLKTHLEKQIDISGQVNYNDNIIVDYSIILTPFNGEKHSILILKDITHINKLEKERVRAELAEKGSLELKKEIKERKKVEKKLEEQSNLLSSIIENSSNTLIWSIDKDFNLISFNSQFKDEMMLYTDNIELGMDVFEIFKYSMSSTGVRETKNVFKKVLKGKMQVVEGLLISKTKKHWFETFLGPIYNIDRAVNQITCVSHNITEKKQINNQLIKSLEEKEVLLKEVHHRVKNNLQVVSSILNLQSSYIKDPKILDALSESQNRIKSMSLIHENLYQTKDFSSVDLSEYIKNLVSNLVHSYQVYDVKIEYVFDFKGIKLNLDSAIPCGLIINEIISNTLKYAFFDREKGTISLSIKEIKNKYYMEIADDGIGLPDNFDFENTESLGMQLISSLIQQINGTMQLIKDNGTKYLIIFEN